MDFNGGKGTEEQDKYSTEKKMAEQGGQQKTVH